MSCLFSWLACRRLAAPTSDVQIELPNGVIQVKRGDRSKRGEALACAAQSFAGTAHSAPEGTLDWICGPKLKNQWDDPRRLKLTSWVLKMVDKLVHDIQGGFALAALRENGEVGAVIFVTQKLAGAQGSTFAINCRLLGSILCGSVGLPPFKELGDAKAGIKARFKELFKIEELQKKHVPFPHVYVNVMAVHPDAQGQGFCSLMMRRVNEYADSLNLPLWLETSGTRNVEIYKKFGYEVVEQFTIETENDPDNSEPHTDEFGMFRPAANPKATQPLKC